MTIRSKELIPAGVGRRALLAASAAVTIGVATPTYIGGPAYAASSADQDDMPWDDMQTGPKPTMVLVHGAFADGSSWAGVVERLQALGYPVIAMQNRLSSLTADMAATRRVIDAVGASTVVVGHSYGGAVITGATAGAANVAALVYVAAVAPDLGENIGGLLAKYPPSYGRQFVRIDAAGDAIIDRAHFRKAFAHDVNRRQAALLAAAQKPIAVTTQFEPIGVPGWREHPSYFAISAQDRQLSVQAQRDFAHRMKATTITLDASHASYVSRPGEITRLILTAVARHGRGSAAS